MKFTCLILLSGTLWGCALPQSPDISAQNQALQLVDQGTYYVRAGELDRAEAAFKVAYEAGKLAAAVDGLGCVAFLRGNAQSAERYFIQAYQMDESYNDSLANLALLYESRGLYSKAEAMYRLAIKQDPRNFRARNNFAGLLFDNNKGGSVAARVAREELLKAEALAEHPLIKDNLNKIEAP